MAQVLILLIFSFCPCAVQAYDFQACIGCHAIELDEASDRFFLHVPFVQRQCAECHAAQPLTLPPSKLPVQKIKRNKIQWLGDTAVVEANHAFLLPGEKVGSVLVAELQGADGRLSRQDIDVPLLAELTEVQDFDRPPVLTNVRVLKVQRGVFLSVTIGWQTDTLADALVRYGGNDLLQTSGPSKRLGLEHQVVLFNLQPDKTYRYTAVSRDLFGRSHSSEALTFSTSAPFSTLPQEEPGSLSGSESEIVLSSSFQRLGPDYLLELTLDPSASVFIGSSGEPRNPELIDDGTADFESEESHDGLSSEIVVSMDACHSCHKGQSTATHPVNVYPKAGMVIPPEYPTLPDGRITCNSCHSLHSSDYEYLSRKEGKRELCVGCHKDMM